MFPRMKIYVLTVSLNLLRSISKHHSCLQEVRNITEKLVHDMRKELLDAELGHPSITSLEAIRRFAPISQIYVTQ